MLLPMGAVTNSSFFFGLFWIQKCFWNFFIFVTDGLVLCCEFLFCFCTEYCFCGNSGNKFCDFFGYSVIFVLDGFYEIFLLPTDR